MKDPKTFLGRTFLVTGANTGIGRATALELARRGGQVWIACRSIAKGAEVRAELAEGAEGERGRIEVLELDLADLASVRRCADTFLAKSGGTLDVLLNNAGIAWTRGGLSANGFELHFAVNHLGHFLLTKLLLGALRSAPVARIVNVASKAHYAATGIPWDMLRKRTKHIVGRPEYCVSKLCNVLHAKHLARELADTNVRTYSLHPGVVATDIWRSVPWPFRRFVTRKMMSNEDGARTSLHCATSPDVANESGLYYDACAPKAPSALAEDPALARELCERSEAWVEPFLR